MIHKTTFRNLVATALFALAFVQTSAADRPNIFLSSRTILATWTSAQTIPKVFCETPNIDALAKRGMRFTDSYAACVCSPARASILTDKYPQSTGVTDYVGANQPEKWKRPTKLRPAPYTAELALNETTLAEAFQAQGRCQQICQQESADRAQSGWSKLTRILA